MRRVGQAEGHADGLRARTTVRGLSPGKARPVIRILIVDDHPLFRAGLANLLDSEPDFHVIGKAANGLAAVRLWEQERPQVVVLDLSMPGIDGFETLRRIRAIDPAARAIVLTSSESAEDAQRALHAGARGYLTKHIDQDEIVAAIRTVHAGGTRVQDGLASAVRAGPAGLSTREIEVLVFLRKGFSNAEIGRSLGITERTVKAHVAAILKKLHASDRAGAVAKGFDLGILKPAPSRGDDLS
jgi:DNA-binding NarL/FixJ family response regulator